MRVLLVAERMNLPRRPSLDKRCASDPRLWLEVSLSIGAYGTGIARRGLLGERKLRSIGLVWHEALNLLPPSPHPGEWCTRTASLLAGHAWSLLQNETFTHVVCLGRRVEQAMAGSRSEYFELTPVDLLTAGERLYRLTVPHPSGSNLWWNNPDNLTRARTALAWMTIS